MLKRFHVGEELPVSVHDRDRAQPLARGGPDKKSFVVIGSLNMDLAMRVSRAPDPGETLTGKGFVTVPSGKGANRAMACARLGGRTTLIGRVGPDLYRAALREALAADGVDIVHVSVDRTAATGVAMILVDDAAENRIILAPGANATPAPEHLDAAMAFIEQAALIVLQLEIPLATVEYAINLAARLGKPVPLNPAPAQSLPERLRRHIDYLVLNETKAALLTGLSVKDAD